MSRDFLIIRINLLFRFNSIFPIRFLFRVIALARRKPSGLIKFHNRIGTSLYIFHYDTMLSLFVIFSLATLISC